MMDEKLLSNPAFAQMWRDAVREFAVETQVDLNDPRIPHPQSVDDLLTVMKSRNAEFQTNTSSGLKFTKYLRAAIGPFEMMNNMFGGAAGLAFPPSSQILGAVSVLVSACNRTAQSFDAVSGLFETMSAAGDRLREFVSVKIHEAMRPILVEILVSTLKILALATKRAYSPKETMTKHPHRDRLLRVFKSNVSEFLRQLFTGDDVEISGAVANLDNLVDKEHRMTTTVTHTGVVKIDERTTQMDKTMNAGFSQTMASNARQEQILQRLVYQLDVQSSAKERAHPQDTEAERRSRNKQDLPKSLTEKHDIAKEVKKSRDLEGILKPTAGCMTTLDALRKERVAGTATSIISSAYLRRWLNREVQILLMTGPGGSGKTATTACIVEELQKRAKLHVGSEASRLFVAYYLSEDATATPTANDMLRTLAFQISSNNPIFAQHVTRINKRSRIADMNVEELWSNLFSNYFAESKSSVFVVMDSLDKLEKSDREQLVTCFGHKTPWEEAGLPQAIQLMVVTRTAEEVPINLASDDKLVEVKPDAEHDLPIFVATKLRAAWSSSLISRGLFESALKAIITVSKGNYLLASLLVDEVTSFSREQDARNRINSLPESLEEAAPLVLDRVKRRLDPEDRQDLTDVIGWVVSAHRILSVAELDAFLTLRTIDGARVLDLEEKLNDYFASLFVLSGQDSAEKDRQRKVETRLTEAEQSFLEAQMGRDTGHKPAGGQSGLLLDGSEVDDALRQRLQILSRMAIRAENHLLTHYRRDATIPGITSDQGIDATVDQPSQQAQLQEEGMISDIAFGENLDQMRLTALVRCLDIICGKSCSFQDAQKTARSYCALYLPEHLKDVDPANVSEDVKLEVGRKILILLQDEEIIDQWIDLALDYMVLDLIKDPTFTERCSSWLDSDALRDEVSEENRLWIARVIESPVNILVHLATGHAKRWLKTFKYNAEPNFEFLNAWLAKAGILPLGTDLTTDMLDQTNSTAERIKDVATWASFEHDAFWSWRLARTLRDAGHYDASVECFKRIIELQPKNGAFLLGIAYAYSLKEDYATAISYDLQAIEVWKDAIEKGEAGDNPDYSLIAYLIESYTDLASYYKAIKEMDKAMDTYRLAFEGWEDPKALEWNYRAQAAVTCLRLAFEQENYKDALDLLTRFSQHSKRFDEDFLFVYQEFIFDERTLTRLAFESKQPGIVDTFYCNALWVMANYGQDHEVSLTRLNRALTMRKLDDSRQEEVIGILTTILERESDKDLASGWGVWIRDIAEKSLANIYSNRIFEAREDDEWAVLGNEAEKLMKLVTKSRTDHASEKANTSDCLLIMAAWARTNGRSKRARYFANAKLELAVEMLSDDDADNDSQAWIDLCNALLVLDDAPRTQTAMWAAARCYYMSNHPETSLTSILEDPAPTTTDNNADGEVEEPEADTEGVAEMQKRNADTGMDMVNGDQPEQTTHGASIAADVMAPSPDNSTMAAEAAAAVTEATSPSIPFYYCDGPCSESISIEDRLYRCTHCITDLCVSCYKLLMDNKMTGWSICSRLHKHMLIEGLSEIYDGDMTKVGDRLVPFSEWLSDLKKEYKVGEENND